MNTSVTASGMKVKASAGTGLVISGWNNTNKVGLTEPEGWTVAGASVDLSSINTEARQSTIVPTSTIDAEHWMTATAAASNSAAKATTANYTFYDDTAIEKYASAAYLYNKVEIRTNDNADISGKHLVIRNITASNGASSGNTGLSADLNKAIRIAFVVTIGSEKSLYFYAPNQATYPDINGVKYTANEGGTGYSASAVKMSSVSGLTLNGSGTTSFAISSSSISAATTVEIYVYYDGEDENCKTNNTLNGVDTLTMSVEFAAVENAATPSVTIAQSNATITATPSNASGTISYQWLYADAAEDPENEWGEMGPATTATFTLVNDNFKDKYAKCIMTVGSGTTAKKYTSNAIQIASIEP